MKIEDFMEAPGAAWGARRDVIDRASFNLTQSIETILESRVPLELPDKRPSNEEIMASDEGQRKLAGFMLRRYADRVKSSYAADRSTILFHFDH